MFLSYFKGFGRRPSAKAKKELKHSSNFRSSQFYNLEEPQRVKIPFREMMKIYANPSKPVRVPAVKSDLHLPETNRPAVVWLGHSTLLIHFRKWNILVDPILSSGVFPLPHSIRAFRGTQIYQVSDLPPIDFLVITHDHFDHLDYKTLTDLKPFVKKAIVPLGVSSYLESWGYPKAILHEMDWYDEFKISNDFWFAATPSRHFSGRSLFKDPTLWSSYVIQCGAQRLFLSGDGGYGQHFKAIGQKYGPFSLAFLENGQYNRFWRNIHTFPDELPQIMNDLQAEMIFPIHWSKFNLSDHEWNEPVRALLAMNPKFQVTIPKIGEIYAVGDPPVTEPWWL